MLGEPEHAVAQRPAGGPGSYLPMSGNVLPIANSRGVPGTSGRLAVSQHDGEVVLLANHHVVFGAGAQPGEPVWLLADGGELARIGTARYGKLGTIQHRGVLSYVDCAAVALDHDGRRRRTQEEGRADVARAEFGGVVTKTGAATGTTQGVIVDIAHTEEVVVEGRARSAPGQILVQSMSDGLAFSAEGDSGAVLYDERDRVVGLLWGVSKAGGSIACHIDAVLAVLGLALLGQPRPMNPARTGLGGDYVHI